jgi:hypothetical protein
LVTEQLPWPEDTIVEHALLIARGVRPMALLGSISTDPKEMRRVSMCLDGFAVNAGDDVISFVIDDGNGFAQCGFAAAPWIVGLLRFAHSKTAKRYRHQILGLLLGYSPRAIERHERFTTGQPLVPKRKA